MAKKEHMITKGPTLEFHNRGQGRHVVYKELRDQILSLKLKPGTPLDEKQLSQIFGMSRSPIREALNRLSAENLVVMLSNRSTLVAPLDLTTFPRYVEALDLLQRINARLAAQHRTEAQVEEMLRLADSFTESVKRYDHMEMAEVNKEFHMSIAVAGANSYLARHYEQLLDEGRRMLHLHFDYLADSGKEEVLTHEHHEMVDAIRARDVERADALAHMHTRQFHERFLAFMAINIDNTFDLNISATSKLNAEVISINLGTKPKRG